MVMMMVLVEFRDNEYRARDGKYDDEKEGEKYLGCIRTFEITYINILYIFVQFFSLHSIHSTESV